MDLQEKMHDARARLSRMQAERTLVYVHGNDRVVERLDAKIGETREWLERMEALRAQSLARYVEPTTQRATTSERPMARGPQPAGQHSAGADRIPVAVQILFAIMTLSTIVALMSPFFNHQREVYGGALVVGMASVALLLLAAVVAKCVESFRDFGRCMAQSDAQIAKPEAAPAAPVASTSERSWSSIPTECQVPPDIIARVAALKQTLEAGIKPNGSVTAPDRREAERILGHHLPLLFSAYNDLPPDLRAAREDGLRKSLSRLEAECERIIGRIADGKDVAFEVRQRVIEQTYPPKLR